jgi:hypothetical protein
MSGGIRHGMGFMVWFGGFRCGMVRFVKVKQGKDFAVGRGSVRLGGLWFGTASISWFGLA